MIRKIEAIIREDALSEVKDALHAIGIRGMNVFEIRGHGRQGGVEMAWRGTTYRLDLLPKIQLNVILDDENLDRVIDTIVKTARTGEEGDGIIFVYPVEKVFRIRTGERDLEALADHGAVNQKARA